jgi:hypothetical protein
MGWNRGVAKIVRERERERERERKKNHIFQKIENRLGF